MYRPYKNQLQDKMRADKTEILRSDSVIVQAEKSSNFDVSMGSLDSGEACELVGLFLLSRLKRLIHKDQLGLYWDDCLAAVELPGPEVERLKEEVVKFLSEHNRSITTEVNIKVTDFLDLQKRKKAPYSTASYLFCI